MIGAGGLSAIVATAVATLKANPPPAPTSPLWRCFALALGQCAAQGPYWETCFQSNFVMSPFPLPPDLWDLKLDATLATLIRVSLDTVDLFGVLSCPILRAWRADSILRWHECFVRFSKSSQRSYPSSVFYVGAESAPARGTYRSPVFLWSRLPTPFPFDRFLQKRLGRPLSRRAQSRRSWTSSSTPHLIRRRWSPSAPASRSSCAKVYRAHTHTVRSHRHDSALSCVYYDIDGMRWYAHPFLIDY